LGSFGLIGSETVYQLGFKRQAANFAEIGKLDCLSASAST